MADASLTRQAIWKTLQTLVVMALLIFVPAGSARYWPGWIFLIVVSALSVVSTAYFLRRDPALLARRLHGGAKAETAPKQKVIMHFASAAICALVALPALDFRFGWSHVPDIGIAVGELLVLLGYAVVFRVMQQNSHAAATIQVSRDQPVIDTGLYGHVRHPMYSGALIFSAGTPLALGSYWGLLFTLAILLVLVWRAREEERFLVANLPGYAQYRSRVRYRLIPGVY